MFVIINIYILEKLLNTEAYEEIYLRITERPTTQGNLLLQS